MRYNKKFIQARFEIAMNAINVPFGETYVRKADDSGWQANVGVHFIDHNSSYGGYSINKIANVNGGESQPFGSRRYNASEFVALLDGIIGAAYAMKN